MILLSELPVSQSYGSQSRVESLALSQVGWLVRGSRGWIISSWAIVVGPAFHLLIALAPTLYINLLSLVVLVQSRVPIPAKEPLNKRTYILQNTTHHCITRLLLSTNFTSFTISHNALQLCVNKNLNSCPFLNEQAFLKRKWEKNLSQISTNNMLWNDTYVTRCIISHQSQNRPLVFLMTTCMLWNSERLQE